MATSPSSRPLARLRFPPEAARGRRHPEPPHPYRGEFQRDRDRVVHSRAFRRLENKTQVFTHGLSDHFRNRLTHTIEAAQISRTLAAELGLNVELVETLALVHDIGHPAFGHAGEKALDAAMRARGHSFDHNLHALRTVEDFEVRYAGFRGLNLSFEVREGIIKHSRDYSPEEFPELAEYCLNERPPLEAQLIDLADEIAYNTADLDDGCESRILKVEDIRARVGVFCRAYHQAEAQHPQAPEKLKFNQALRRMFDRFVSDLIRNTMERVNEAGVRTVDDVRAWPERLAAFSPAVDAERREAKAFLHERLYSSPELRPEKEEAERIVTGLFEHFIARPASLPSGYQEKAGQEPLPRVVCDYIAGMTDNFIRELYEKHCGAGSETT
ncbi:MAG: deoxyguanosinetriphosphate triphosphohydrolase [Terriglobales bacterium]